MPTPEAVALLQGLRKRGVEIVVFGDRLRYRPKAEVPPAVKVEIKRYKSDLLEILSIQKAVDDRSAHDVDPVARENRRKTAEKLTVHEITRAAPLRDLPLLLDWLALRHPNLFRRQEGVISKIYIL